MHPISDAEKDRKAADNFDEWGNRWYIDPLFKGAYPPLARKMGLKPDQQDLDFDQAAPELFGRELLLRVFLQLKTLQTL